jgi:predicted enzyme related to lactoylglutathione lyase
MKKGISYKNLSKVRNEYMNVHEKINYVEFPAKYMETTKDFFTKVFGWTFTDYGPEYTAFSDAGIDGGFYKSEFFSSYENGSALIVLYSTNLVKTQVKIEGAGGLIIKPIFSFPGGRRFHFTDPNGNEFAVWSDVN